MKDKKTKITINFSVRPIEGEKMIGGCGIREVVYGHTLKGKFVDNYSIETTIDKLSLCLKLLKGKEKELTILKYLGINEEHGLVDKYCLKGMGLLLDEEQYGFYRDLINKQA